MSESDQSRPRITFAAAQQQDVIALAAESLTAPLELLSKDTDEKEKPKPAPSKVDVDEHLLTPEELIARYNVNVNLLKPAQSVGLNAEEALKRLAEYGPNVLTPAKKVHPFVKWLHCLSQIFNVLLIICAILTWVLYGIDPLGNAPNSYIGAILFGVSLLNATIEWYQLQKSAAILESFLAC
ncbi:hypothetical protein HK096_006986 [Nowakowskiella sp. JEL0078]|nr:hypothetical protein HK096_006986 [Nowakowskiella sp. JEL0078]